MSASVAQVLSSWIRGAGLGRGETLVRRSPLPFPSEDLALTRGRSATPRLLPAMRAGECERRAGVATGTDILHLVARHRGAVYLCPWRLQQAVHTRPHAWPGARNRKKTRPNLSQRAI